MNGIKKKMANGNDFALGRGPLRINGGGRLWAVSQAASALAGCSTRPLAPTQAIGPKHPKSEIRRTPKFRMRAVWGRRRGGRTASSGCGGAGSRPRRKALLSDGGPAEGRQRPRSNS